MRYTLTIGSLRQWHWISSALCLAGLLLFSVTGITLNHAAQIESRSVTTTIEVKLPVPVLEDVRMAADTQTGLPASFDRFVRHQTGARLEGRDLEWSPAELYISMPKPGGDAWISLDLETGDLLFEETHRGWIAYFNDLHKARHTGIAWRWFIDLFAGVCVLFSLTGLLLLKRQVPSRPSTWPITGLGLLVPVLLALLLIH
ncbi:MAG: hypothetical protein CVV16_02970 [Gammaproteobacteria bacterium HGW-Gammaproteobacteria-6]|nr:MAG: hypothetical protein CVV16_02970 [Gammaproteobacteria bacterium HGW-Gammaproteobacteria-6]